MVKQNLSEWKYPPRIHEPIKLLRGNRTDCLRYRVVYVSPHKSISADRYSYAIMSQTQIAAIDCIYDQLHELCVERGICVGSGAMFTNTPPNTFTFGDAAIYTPQLVCRPISASEKRPLFTGALIRIEYGGDHIGTLSYEEDEQVLTKAPNGNCVESINFYLAFKLGKIKNITIQRK